MKSVLKNRELAMTFSRNGPPYTGRVALTLDPSSVSGWEICGPPWLSCRGREGKEH